MDGGRRRSSSSGVVCVGGRMDVATQSGAWAAAAAAAGAPQRRVLFHPALAKGLPSSHHTPSLPRPLNAAMAGCSNPRAAGTSGTSASSSSHPSLTWTPVSRIGAGLSNLGNTCFLNSVLQCLTYTPPLAGYLESGQHKATCRAAGFCAMCALQEHVRQALASSGGVVSPSNLVKNLRCISKSFRMWRQEDAHEYMRYLIEALHNSCLPPGASANSTASQDRSLIHKIFGGRLRSQVKCTLCSTCSNTYDPLLDLSLEIVRADSLTKALNRFTAVEALEGDNKYHCSHCQKKVRALKQFTIDKSPNILTVQFKRFSGSGSSGGKIDKKIEFGRTLDMKPYISNPQDSDAKYSLYAVLVHAGWSTHSGHYYCFIRTAGDMWHALDDSRMKQVSERTVLDQKAYILFYIRDSASRVSGSGEQSTLPSSLPACKRLLSDGAGENTDDADTGTDDLDSSDCQGSRDGGACSHSYGNGNSAVRGQTAAAFTCCPRVRPAGNTQIDSTGDKGTKANGRAIEECPSVGAVETNREPSNTKAAVKCTKVEESAKPVSEGLKIVSEKLILVPENPKLVADSLKVESAAEMDTSGIQHQNGEEATEGGSKDGGGEGDCSTSGKDGDDWDEYYKKCNSATPHSYMRLLYAMPHTRRYFMARALPIQRDRKRVTGIKGQGQVDKGEGEATHKGSSSTRKDGKRHGGVCEGVVLSKKQKQRERHDISPSNVVAEAAEINKECKDSVNGNEAGIDVCVLRKRMEVDDACQGAVVAGHKDVAQIVQNGDSEKAGHTRDCGEATSLSSFTLVRTTAGQQARNLDVIEKVLVEGMGNGNKMDHEHTESGVRTVSPILKHNSKEGNGLKGLSSEPLQSNGLYGLGVARWSDVEANGHGAVKDIDVLLRTDKSSIPKQDAWDEDYDRGKLKKVRNGVTIDRQSPVLEIAGLGAVNPFQALSSAKQRPIDDIHSKGSRQASCAIRSCNAEERRG